MPIGDWLRALPRMWKIRRLFDAKFYLARYVDVRQVGMNPLLHYVRHGAEEGRKPHRFFEPDYYLSGCPSARKCENPLLHFIETGGRLGNPHPLFDCESYLAEYPEVAARGLNPLVHYLGRNTPRKSATRGSRADEGVRPTSAQSKGRLEILDVEVEVDFWEDDSGRMNFTAEPQQRPFFRAMRFDQLSAQIKP
jgi:hypothetical protein